MIVESDDVGYEAPYSKRDVSETLKTVALRESWRPMKLARCFAVAVLGLAWGCSSTESDSALSSEVALEANEGREASVLVFLRESADVSAALSFEGKTERGRFVYRTLVDHAKRTQADLVKLLTSEGATFQRFHLVNAILVERATPALVRQLGKRPEVKRVALDNPMPITLPESSEDDSTRAAQANISSTNAERVWTELGAMGEGVVVAGQDTGYKWDHAALKRAYRGWDGATADHRYSWHDAIKSGSGSNPCGFNASAPCDDHGHGTHTMGTIVGDDGDANKIGMAPGARWIGCRNMNAGAGRPSTYLDCLEWFLAPYPQGGDPETEGKPEMAPHVINNSWGCDGSEGCSGTELVQAVENLEAAGILMVVSAGKLRLELRLDQRAARDDQRSHALGRRARSPHEQDRRLLEPRPVDARRQDRPRRHRARREHPLVAEERRLRLDERHLDGRPARRRRGRAPLVRCACAPREAR